MQFANFIVGTGLSYTYEQYLSLTIGQRNAITAATNAKYKRR